MWKREKTVPCCSRNDPKFLCALQILGVPGLATNWCYQPLIELLTRDNGLALGVIFNSFVSVSIKWHRQKSDLFGEREWKGRAQGHGQGELLWPRWVYSFCSITSAFRGRLKHRKHFSGTKCSGAKGSVG